MLSSKAERLHPEFWDEILVEDGTFSRNKLQISLAQGKILFGKYC